MNLIRPRSEVTHFEGVTRTEHWDGRRDISIAAPTAVALQRPGPEQMQHHCPFCRQTYSWAFFKAHLFACIAQHPEHPDAIAYRERSNHG